MKQITLLLIGLVCLYGCKKDNDSDEQYLRMTIGGTSVECSRDLSASIVMVSSPGLLSINGAWTQGSIEIDHFGYTGLGEAQVSTSIGLRFTLREAGTHIMRGMVALRKLNTEPAVLISRTSPELI